MLELVKLILTVTILVLCLVFTKGFFSACEAERKGAVWKPYPKRKPKRSYDDEEERRFLVSLENGNVIIMNYSFKEESFEHEGVDGYRELPKCRSWFKKMAKGFMEERKS